jgi:hypothetical protein
VLAESPSNFNPNSFLTQLLAPSQPTRYLHLTSSVATTLASLPCPSVGAVGASDGANMLDLYSPDLRSASLGGLVGARRESVTVMG